MPIRPRPKDPVIPDRIDWAGAQKDGKIELYNIAANVSEKHDLAESQPKLAHDMLVQLTDWLQTNCTAAYLPVPNPKFDPKGKLPYGPYVPLEKLKTPLQTRR